ncbi:MULTISPECIES: sugar ABC transporter permease [Allobranchiibius]|uniref:Xylose transport system permease protein XylH n=1 Tax=Allobranchiibius huperziae TaxID=1874116 RepID=A0A853DHD1_9MICO|nr:MULTISPECIES: sugar ABC transporter permease [Allobranchiibius]NYJ73605.1 D-xylose transport system permease protein [Allobranchiibius huperziae]UIJ34914.1 sugar ABC transporter permease [Allobranchiibius sp. GilTou73]
MAQTATPPPKALDQQDARVKVGSGSPKDMLTNFGYRVRSGDLGPLPVVIGLIVIAVVFQALNSLFLSSGNLVNLIYDSSAVGMIALGIVFVLVLGEIDLSVGSLSGLSSALLGVLYVNKGWNPILAIVVAALSGALIGFVYAQVRNRFGMPSFVITLAGLLAFLGLQLQLLGSQGSINLPYGSGLVTFGQQQFLTPILAYIVAVLAAAAVFVAGILNIRRRRAANLSASSPANVVIRAVALLVVLLLAAWYLNRDNGVPWMFAIFVLMIVAANYALTKTNWGRHMFAVGGNEEAARRAGINVNMIYTSAFVLTGLFAAVGGVLSAARLASSSQSAGTGDVNLNAIAAAVIGGTSLFGGRGSAYSALLGILVIQSISNGLTLLNLSSAYRYMITGAVLALAVLIDSLARRSRVQHGTA